ncbi:hypothetical protein S40288_08839 [Stachybotrys chartarum IBT 40288]|nr:hypothetical protein S40288_08839 [Stachybotrys chartarum IBT 40288]
MPEGDMTEMPPGYAEEDRSAGLEEFTIVMMVLTVLAIAARFWSRAISKPQARHLHRFWWDDWTALISVPFILTQFGLQLAIYDLGWGHHISTLPIEDIVTITELTFGLYYMYDVALFLTKLSALFFIRRIFPREASPRWFNIAMWVAYFCNAAQIIGLALATMFFCRPIARSWDPTIEGECPDNSGLWISGGVTAIFVDLIILLLPLPRIWRLQTSRPRRIGIMIIFLLGYCAIFISVGRLIQTIVAADAMDADVTYEGVFLVYWLSAEVTLLEICICLPAMLPLGRYLLTSYFSPLASSLSHVFSTQRSSNAGSANRGAGFPLRSINNSGKFHATETSQSIGAMELEETHSMNTVRDETQGKAAADDLAVGGEPPLQQHIMEVWILNLEFHDSIAGIAEKSKPLQRLDIIILNAGLGLASRVVNQQTGQDEMIRLHYLSTALLVILLLPIDKDKHVARLTFTCINLTLSEVAV